MGMKSILRTLLYPLIAVLVILFVHQALAEMPGSKPLVVLRFNQSRVYYEQPLYQAIEKAVAVKPGVMFDVVSLAPSTGQAANDAAWQQTASAHAQQVVASMQQMGVPMSRISVRGQSQPGIPADEVHIYVR